MPKMKTKRAAAKRFTFTGSGKLTQRLRGRRGIRGGSETVERFRL
jgi:ribosomal protein L35